MPKPYWLGVGAGCGIALIIAVIMAYLGWRENPSGIYYGPDGTNWAFVWDTGFSWFWPVAVTLIPLICLAVFARRWARRHTRRDQQKSG